MTNPKFIIRVCALIFCNLVLVVSSTVDASGFPNMICWEMAPAGGEISTLQFVVSTMKSGYYILQGRHIMDTHVYETQPLNGTDTVTKPTDISDSDGAHFVGGAQVLGDRIQLR